MKQGLTIQQLNEMVMRRAERQQDIVLPARMIQFELFENGMKYIAHVDGHGEVRGRMTKWTVFQLTTFLSVPATFVKLLLQEDRELLKHIVNERIRQSLDHRMLRTVKNDNDEFDMVGFVSPSYSRLYDNHIILKALMPLLQNDDFEVETCSLGHTTMHISVLTDKLKGEVRVGDVVQGGFKMRNSEVGASRLMFARLLYRLWCSNGCTNTEITSAYSRIHRGKKQDDGFLPRVTVAQDYINGIMIDLRDKMAELLDKEAFMLEIEQLRAATRRLLTGKDDAAAQVEALGKIVGFTLEEGEGILAHYLEAQDWTLYGLINAVTRYAQDVDSYDRSMELEQIGGDVLNLSDKDWQTVSEAKHEH